MNVGKASISKRILSGVLDIILIFLFTTLFMFGIFNLFVKNDQTYQDATKEYQQIHIDSHLFTLDNGELKLIDENFDENIKYCFLKYESLELYEEHKEKSELFLEDGSVKEGITPETVLSFYYNEINYAITNFIQAEPAYISTYNKIIKVQTAVIISSAILSTLIFELIIQLCAKNGKTIGKLITHLAIVGSDGFKVKKNNIQDNIVLYLKYSGKERVITGLKRISKPGLRVYAKAEEIPTVLSGLGIAIISTSKGLMTDRDARKASLGGEVLAYIW